MTVPVSDRPVLPAAADCKIGKPMSVVRLAHPVAVTANHVLGYLLGGLRHVQRAFRDQTTAGTARVRTYRHPNCTHVDVLVEIAGFNQNDCTIDVQAGAGTTQSLTLDFADRGIAEGEVLVFRAPWDSGDSGKQDITVDCTDCSIQALAVFDVPREDLDSTSDDAVDLVDSTYPRVGLLPERYIADSDEAGPEGLIDSVTDAWDDYHPQHLSWWTWEDAPLESTATSFGGAGSSSDIFDGLTIQFKARAKRSSDTRSTVEFDARCWCSSAVTSGELKVTASNPGSGADDSATSSVFTGTSKAWTSVSVEVDCTQDASITVELRSTTGSGTIFCSGLSAIGVD